MFHIDITDQWIPFPRLLTCDLWCVSLVRVSFSLSRHWAALIKNFSVSLVFLLFFSENVQCFIIYKNVIWFLTSLIAPKECKRGKQTKKFLTVRKDSQVNNLWQFVTGTIQRCRKPASVNEITLLILKGIVDWRAASVLPVTRSLQVVSRFFPPNMTVGWCLRKTPRNQLNDGLWGWGWWGGAGGVNLMCFQRGCLIPSAYLLLPLFPVSTARNFICCPECVAVTRGWEVRVNCEQRWQSEHTHTHLHILLWVWQTNRQLHKKLRWVSGVVCIRVKESLFVKTWKCS